MDTTESPKFIPKMAARVAHAPHDTPVFNPGRRPEIQYRDLFVKDATDGQMRCEVMHVVPGAPTVPTGWHYHTADVQFLYILKGWVDMEIDGIGKVRLSEHDSVMIPGGTVHQELRASDEMQLLEVSLPAALGTVNCGPPGSN